MPTLRAVLDTNVLLSGIAYPGSVPGKLIGAWRHGALELVLSGYILEELRRVLPKLAHRHSFGANEVEDLIDALAIQVEMVDLTDVNDLPVLGTLIAAVQGDPATLLITGDKALLALSDRYPIRTAVEFWEAHGGL